MGRSMSPVLRQELANLDKGADCRKSAMKALHSYVNDLDCKEIPNFLAQVSETKDGGTSFGEYTISLYEVLARVHGPNIVSEIDNIMTTIITTLTTSGGSFPLQQACSKVVPSIARYGIQPTNPEEKKRRVIHSLCKPLSDSLLCKQESLSCGSALCLKALVDCENWRFACDDMVSELCLKLASALEDKQTQTNSHMGLVMSLAKNNSLIVEAYAHMFIRAGLRILNCGQIEKNSQKRLTAIQMVHSLMKYLDIRSICRELESIIEEMEKCQSDQLHYVKGAAFEALHTAKRLLVEKASKIDYEVISVTGSNFSRRRCFSSPRDRSRSPLSGSPESQTLDSFAEYESFIESPISTTQGSCNGSHTRKNVNRKLWNHENGYVNGFPGFVLESSANEARRSGNPSPQRTRSQINVDNIRIYSTPRKLVCSLQDDNENSENPGDKTRRHISGCSAKCQWSPVAKYVENGHSNRQKQQSGSEATTDSESVLSTEEFTNTGREVQRDTFREGENKSQVVKSSNRRKISVLFFIMLLVSAVFASIMLFDCQDDSLNFVPT